MRSERLISCPSFFECCFFDLVVLFGLLCALVCVECVPSARQQPPPQKNNTPFSHQARQLRQRRDDVRAVPSPLGAGVAQQVQLAQRVVGAQRGAQREQALLGHKVEGEVELGQRLAAREVLHLGHVVDGQVEVLQVLFFLVFCFFVVLCSWFSWQGAAAAAAARVTPPRSSPAPPTHLELVQVLEPADQVVLQVQDLELGAEAAEQLDALEVELVQRHLFECGQEAVVVLGALRGCVWLYYLS